MAISSTVARLSGPVDDRTSAVATKRHVAAWKGNLYSGWAARVAIPTPAIWGRRGRVRSAPIKWIHVTQSGVPRHRIGVEASDGEVYRKYADDLTRFATGLVGPSNAADVVSDAVLSCFGSPGWSTVHEKRSYLYRSVFNRAAEFHRATGRRRAREERVALPDLVDPPEVRPEVLRAVQALSVKQRAVIVLTYWEDLGPSAIAQLMGISEGAVKRHLARARSHLKEELKTHE
jgi:RNA polymerase sigma factor (sigma-70 family)